MTSSGPWSVKGIDPKAREIAKDLARRSGMTLGEWLNQMITDGGADGSDSPYLRGGSGFSDHEAGRDPASDIWRGRFDAAADPYPPRDPYDQDRRANERRRRDPRVADPLVSAHESQRIAAALDDLTTRLETAENRSGAAIHHVDAAVRSALARLDAGERDSDALMHKVEGALHLLRAEQRRTDDRVARIELDSAGRVDALRALEAAVYRIEPVDEDKVADAAVERMSTRLAEAETRTREAILQLEKSLSGLDRRLSESEDRSAQSADRTAAAIDSAERQLERLAESLGDQVAQARRDMAEKLRVVAQTDRIEILEDAINQLAGQVDRTEKSSGQAIDRLGQEVMKIAEAINQRVSVVERRNDRLADSLTGEIGKIAGALEQRLLKSDYAHTEALQKLSGDIRDVAERLTERVARTEGRTTEALAEFSRRGPNMEGAAAAIKADVASEIADRIRKSEDRTAKLLEESQARIEARLAQQAQKAAASSAATPRSAFVSGPDPFAEEPQAPTSPVTTSRADAGFVAPPPVQPISKAEPPEWPSTPDLPEEEDHFETQAAPVALAPKPAPPAFKAHDSFIDPFDDPVFAEDADFVSPALDDPFAKIRPPESPERRSLVRREALDALRAGEPFPDSTPEAPFVSPHAHAEPEAHGWPAEPEAAPHETPHVAFGPEHEKLLAAFDDVDFGDESFGSVADAPRDGHGFAADEPTFSHGAAEAEPERVSTRDLIARARSAARENNPPERPQKEKNEGKSGPFGLNLSLPKRKSRGPGGGTVTLLLASAVSITVTATVLGYLIVNDSNSDSGHSEPLVAHRDSRPKSADPRSAEPATAGAAQLAVATSPDPSAGARSGGESTDAKDVYQTAARQLDAGDPKGVATLTKAATLGYAPAQFHLSTLFDKGASGAPKDPAKARLWAERAAQAGVPKAMYNLGLFLFDGKGGPPDLPAAAAWFRKAADLGLVDAQYNLARLYENGYGVQQNAGQAYTWYLIASNGGDQDARADATRIRASLDKTARSAAERAANAFRAASSAVEDVASSR